MSETYEKVRVSELRPGDVVQVYAFVDTDAFEVTHIEVSEGVATLTVRISEAERRVHAGVSIDSLVFRVKKGEAQMNLTTDESTHLQMANALEEQAREIEAMAAERMQPLSYRRLTMVNQSRELARVARAQLRAAGVICHQREVV